jgi:hypothetical protein
MECHAIVMDLVQDYMVPAICKAQQHKHVSTRMLTCSFDDCMLRSLPIAGVMVLFKHAETSQIIKLAACGTTHSVLRNTTHTCYRNLTMHITTPLSMFVTISGGHGKP